VEGKGGRREIKGVWSAEQACRSTRWTGSAFCVLSDCPPKPARHYDSAKLSQGGQENAEEKLQARRGHR